MRRLVLAITMLATVASACTKSRSGEEVFSSEFCPTCHYFRGIGRDGGIDLSEVRQRRSKGWIKEHIVNPKIHDPNIGMPNHAHLSNAELNALVEFLTSTEKLETPRK
jgi:cbb3-type cytochrome oxidase cytochrome c subunit